MTTAGIINFLRCFQRARSPADLSVYEMICFICSVLCLCSQVIILIGNKADLEAQRDVTFEEAKQFAEENGGSEPEPWEGEDFVMWC